MIRYTQGNLLDAPAEALINTVNEVGVMGKGIALMFREAFPENTRAYEAACKAGEVRVGRMFGVENHDLTGPRWIINFPTKRHWRHPSRMEWVREGLADLAKFITEKRIRSVAIPPLGCGQGGLEWAQVRREIEFALGGLPEVELIVFEPTATYQNNQKRAGVEKLTSARALVAELVRRYLILGIECSNLEVQKLAWFLQRSIRRLGLEDPLRLRYKADRYGPYADNLRHLLDGLDGSYLHCERRLADAGPADAIWFEDDKREQVAAFLAAPESARFLPALEETTRIIDGFESPLGMELLATVDWLLAENRTEPTVETLKNALASWPGPSGAGQRKLRLFDDRMLALALGRLTPQEPPEGLA